VRVESLICMQRSNAEKTLVETLFKKSFIHSQRFKHM
jgi:hypothetical protein